MKINSIILENFRKYKNLELDFDDSRNIIVGENAQGKTNLVEAIYLTAFARSFRTNNSSDLIMFGENSARVSTDLTSEDIDKNINIIIRNDGKKMIKKDGKVISKTTELLNNVVVIIFSPDDLRIIKDSPDRRRTFINRELSQMRPMYYDALRRYNEALREKNALVYAVDASFTQFADNGSLLIYFGCEKPNLARCITLVHGELAALRDKPLGDRALRAAKKQLLGQMAVSADNGEAQALSMAKAMLVFGEILSDEEVRRRIEAITSDSLRAVAAEVLAEDRLSTLIFK